MEELIYTEDSPIRIDQFLSKNLNYSRNFFHHIIKRWGILVNNKPVKKSYKLKPNDKIQIENLERYLDSSFLEELPFIEIPIILEKEDYLVLNKPKWVLSHPNSIWDLSAPSVVAFLYQKYKNLPSIWNFIRAGLVHRLDKDTDGLMIVAKTEKWLKHFKELFNKKSQLVEKILPQLNQENPNFERLEEIENSVWIKKFYKAIVNLTPKGKIFLNSINLPYYISEIVKPKVPYPWQYKIGITKIVKSEKWIVNSNSLSCTPAPQSWYPASQSCNPALNPAILYLQIITWRTHQIRYHLSQKGLPIVGDKLYGHKEKVPMQLTAYKLEFLDPDQNKISLEI